MPFKIIYDKHGNRFCGVNNFARNLSFLAGDRFNSIKTNVVNIHYPVSSIYYSLFLVMYAAFLKIFFIRTKLILTLHEYASSATLRKVTSYILVKLCDRLVLTNPSEYEVLKNIKNTNTISIIPIFSNITCKEIIHEDTFKNRKILLMGIFYPSRKITEIIRDFNKAGDTGFELEICGTPHSRYPQYYEEIKSLCIQNKNVLLNIGLPDDQICKILNRSFCGIGLYEDGISSKRTSSLVFFQAGLPLISNIGPHTENIFIGDENYCQWEGMEKSIKKLLNKEYYDKLSENSIQLYKNYFSKDTVILKYGEVIKSVCR